MICRQSLVVTGTLLCVLGCDPAEGGKSRQSPAAVPIVLQPDFILGEAQGISFGQLGDLVEFADGSVAVADNSERRIVHLDSSGRILNIWGRSGRGPGEFQRISRLWGLGVDSILAHDFFSHRITVLERRTGIVGQYPVEVPPGHSGFAQPGGATAQGYVLWGGPAITPSDPPVTDRNPITLYVMRSDTLQSVLAGYRGAEAYRGTGRNVTQLPIARNTLFFVRPDRVYSLDTVEDTVRVRALSGEPLDRISLGITPREVTAEEIAMDRRYRIAENRRQFAGQGVPESFVAGREQVLERVPYPRFWPTASDVLVDEEMRLWVRRDISPAVSEHQEWEVRDPEGHLLTRFRLAEVERISVPRRGRFWAVQPDSVGAPRLSRYSVPELASP